MFRNDNRSVKVNTETIVEEVESPLSTHYASDDFIAVGRQADQDLHFA